MKIVDPAHARRGGESAHRPGGIAFTYLLEGEEFAPDNHGLMLVHVAEHYEAVRHRHNFEQVRVMLDGSFGFGPGMVQGPGSVGYFCEGTWYTQQGHGPSTTLLLQVAGASGAGYMSEPQMRSGVSALQALGEFRDGIYTWHDASGKKHNQDGYEATWEHVFGRAIDYPAARYDAPVLLRPERFGWVADPKLPAVSHKHLGTFNERGLALAGWRLAAGGSAAIAAGERRLLGYVMAGTAALDTGQAIGRGWAFEALPGETLGLSAASGPCALELLLFTLPRF